MPRSKRFITGLLSSYAAIAVNVFYTIASVPLALHYLSKEEFGLWALVTQLSGYLMLLEFGMSGSVARSLSDHKDHIEDGIYGNILRTGARVFIIQGFFVALLGGVTAWCAPTLLGLPLHLQHPFAVLMAVQALLTGTRLAVGSLASPLWCHQRLDLSNLAGSVSLIVSFTVLWLGFHLGWHFYSLPVSTAAGFAVSLAVTYYSCLRLGFYPPREYRGRFDPTLFRTLLQFGSGIFLMNLGAQLASASQVILVSRLLGMEAATIWSVATKIFSMAQQFVSRVFDSSAGGLAEMVVRRESAQLQRRFQDLIAISAVMAAAASAAIALTNGPFIQIWTSGEVAWTPWNNLLLAFVLFTTAITRCHTGLVGITKEIRGMKYIYLFEGFAFVAVAVLLVPQMGLAGLLVAALICNLGITGTYGVRRTAGYFGISWLEVVNWIARPAAIMLLTTGVFALTRIPPLTGLATPLRLLIGASVFTLAMVPALWFFGIDPGRRRELASLLAGVFAKAKAKLRPA